MLSWTDLTRKAVRLSRDTTPGTLVQLEEDMNQGYQEFNARLGRYWSRKQQFTDIIDGQGIYQTPIDAVRIIGMTVQVSDTYSQPVKEIRSEFEWRDITAYPYNSNWPAFYFVIGNDEVALWPTPSQDVTNGLRYYYQVQDHFLSVDDTVSISTNLVTMTNGSPTVTSAGTPFTPQMQGLWFQLTGVTDLSWYEIVDVPNTSTLTLKSAFVGLSGASQAWRVGQMPIIPGEYHSKLVDYALALFFSSKGNESRADTHQARYDKAVEDAISEYASSTEGNIITDSSNYYNPWLLTPLPGNP